MSAPWAQSFAMNSDACSPSVFPELSAVHKTRFRGLATGLCLRLGGLLIWIECGAPFHHDWTWCDYVFTPPSGRGRLHRGWLQLCGSNVREYESKFLLGTQTIFSAAIWTPVLSAQGCPKTCQTLFLPRLMWFDGCTKPGMCFRAFWAPPRNRVSSGIEAVKKRTGDWIELGRGYCNTNANDDHFCKKYFVEKLGHKWTCDRRSWTLKGISNMSKQYTSQKCQKICARKYTVTDACVWKYL